MKKLLLLICLSLFALGLIAQNNPLNVSDINHYIIAHFDDGTSYNTEEDNNFGSHCRDVKGFFSVTSNQMIPNQDTVHFMFVSPTNDSVIVSATYPNSISYSFSGVGIHYISFSINPTNFQQFYPLTISDPNPNFMVSPPTVFLGQAISIQYDYISSVTFLDFNTGDNTTIRHLRYVG